MRRILRLLISSARFPVLKFTCTIVLLFSASVYTVVADIQIEKAGKRISVTGKLPKNVKEVQIQFTSSRNHSISHYQQVSPFDPGYNSITEKENWEWNIFYPVVDITVTKNMHGVAEFEKSCNSEYTVNGMFIRKLFHLDGNSIIIDSEHLYNWENNILLQPAESKMKSFHLIDKVPVTDGILKRDYCLLTEEWRGEVSVSLLPDNKILKSVLIMDESLPEKPDTISKIKFNVLSRETLLNSLVASAKFTMRCQDKSVNSETRNGLNIFYDLDAKTFRRPTWIWAWGPSIRLLLECSEIPEVNKIIPSDTLVKIAKEVGVASLRFQERDPENPAFGIITSRWSESTRILNENHGFEQYFSIADAQFLVGWGWIPLYKSTGDKRFLEGAKLLTETTGKLIRTYDIIPMDYMARASRWKDFAINEQGFGVEGINELYKVENNQEYQNVGDSYMKMLLKKFDTEDGLWNRTYRIDKKLKVPDINHTRAQGWAMEGLLAAYELTMNPEYLDKAKKMAAHLIKYQFSDGSWSFIFNPMSENEISEKGTALWCLLFYKLYNYTKDADYLFVARKALKWCLNNQYNGTDPLANGGLIGISRASGVIYRDYFPLECIYTTGFFGLAVIEELHIQSSENIQN